MYLWSPKTHKVRYQMTSVSQFLNQKRKKNASVFFLNEHECIFFYFDKDVRVFETGKKTAPKMDGATISFSRKGAKLGAVLSNGTYIWNIQSGEWCRSLSNIIKWLERFKRKRQEETGKGKNNQPEVIPEGKET